MPKSKKDQSNKNLPTNIAVPENYGQRFEGVVQDSWANNKLIAHMGIKCMHWMAVPDCINQRVEGDLRTSYENSFGEERKEFKRENGFIYVPKKEVYVTFTNNHKNLQNTPAGLYAEAGAYATVNQYYINTEEEIHISEFDKLIPCDIGSGQYSSNWQKFKHNPTGIDRMQFKVEQVEFLIDSAGIIYSPNVDFYIQEGTIRWVDGRNRPGIDPLTKHGRMCSIRYTYKPLFYIKTVVHDFRSIPQLNELAQVQVKRGPMQVILQADWVFLDVRRKAANGVDELIEAEDTSNTGLR